jgi:hypothetical protein
VSFAATPTGVTLTNAIIPAVGNCSIMVPVQAAMVGSYVNTVAVKALTTGPAGSNAAPATATLTVVAPSGGGGAIDWWDMLFVAGALLACRRHGRRKPPRP